MAKQELTARQKKIHGIRDSKGKYAKDAKWNQPREDPRLAREKRRLSETQSKVEEMVRKGKVIEEK